MRWAAADIECWFDIYWTHCPLGDLTDCCSQSLAEHRRRLADSASLDQTTAKSRCGLFGRWHRALMLINYSLCNTGESQRRLLNEKPAYLNVSNISKKTSNSKHLYSGFRLLSGYCDQETWIMCKLREHQSCMTVKATVGDVNCKCLSLLPLTVFLKGWLTLWLKSVKSWLIYRKRFIRSLEVVFAFFENELMRRKGDGNYFWIRSAVEKQFSHMTDQLTISAQEEFRD